MKYTLDSSFLVALFYSSDINHEKAKNILIAEKLLECDIFINNFIIEEVTTVLTYKWWKKLWDNFLNAINVFNIIYCSTSIEKYISFFKNFESKISFADIAILYDSLAYNTKLISFDKQQNNLYKKYSN